MKKIILGISILTFAFATTAMAAELLNVVSDRTTEWSSDGSTNWQSAVPTYVHPSWPSISGATWIWRTAQTNPADEYANVPEGGWYFKKTFEVPQCSKDITGSIQINSDNAEALYFNGAFIGSDGALSKNGPDTQTWSTIKTYTISPVVGENTILVRAINYSNSGTYASNPAGLTFKATVNYTPSDCDDDDDGVLNEDDLCSGTVADVPTVKLGVNRHVWFDDDGDHFTTLVPGKKGAKGVKTEEDSQFSLSDTYGCSCEQILDELVEATELSFEGHYKYGCSKSIIEDWIAGEYYVGPTFVETVEVPATNNTGIDSVNILESGKSYLLKVDGTYRFANWGDYGVADAEYAYRNDAYALPLLPDEWTLGENSYPSILGLDVQVDGNNVYWGDYNSTHVYTYTYAGTGNLVHFHIYDSAYGDNSGFLTVDIFEDKWVDLW